MHGSHCCDGDDDEPNGSKAVGLLLRLATLGLALSSAVVMATASQCTTNVLDHASRGKGKGKGTTVDATVTFKDYPPFVNLVWFNIAAAVLEALGIYLQLSNKAAGDGEDDGKGKFPRAVLAAVDSSVQTLVSLSTGAMFAAVTAYSPEISACTGAAGSFCDEVQRSKLLSLGATVTVGLADVIKDVKLPFSLWPSSSD